MTVPTVPQVVRLYLANLESRVLAGAYDADAFANATRDLSGFAAQFGVPVAECRQHDVSAWLDAHPGWKSAATKRRAVNVLLACFHWAAEEELIDRCPYHRPSRLRGLEEKPRRPADPSDYVALMGHGTSRAMRRALFFLRRSGIRTSELRRLTWPEVRIDDEIPHLCLETHKTARKTGKPRLIGLDRATAAFLRALRRQATAGGLLDLPVFLNTQNQPWTRFSFASHLRDACRRAGVHNVTGYCFRHGFTVAAVERGTDSKWIADHLGHADTRMIERVYGTHTRDRLKHLGHVAGELAKRRG